MKKLIKIFLICYIFSSAFFIYFFGNMNFFGESGFHMNVDDLIIILCSTILVYGKVFSK